MTKHLNLTLKVWRQDGPNAAGHFETYEARGIADDASFLEMLDVVNERLIGENKEPITFESDCREGICGTCGLTINGIPHGKEKGTATCQLHMRKFNDGDHIAIEPFRAHACPISPRLPPGATLHATVAAPDLIEVTLWNLTGAELVLGGVSFNLVLFKVI